MSDSPAPIPPETAPQRRIHPWTIPGLMILIALGFVVGINYVLHVVRDKASPDTRLPYLSRLDKDLEALSHEGKTVRLGLGSGIMAKDRVLFLSHGDEVVDSKVVLLSYLFTRCPSGCSGIQAEMAAVREEFQDPRLHFLSVSLDPEHDSPEILEEFRKLHELEGENWWFLTGDPKELASYMAHKVGFHAPQPKEEKDMRFEGDLFDHDMRIVLVDHLGRVRGKYEVMHPQAEIQKIVVKKLRDDIRGLLKEREEALGEAN